MNQVSKNDFNKMQQKQIKECIRAFDIDFQLLQILKNLFMECDDNHDGIITRQDLIRLIYEKKQMFPQTQLNFFLNALVKENIVTEDGGYLEKLEGMLTFDGSLSKELSFAKL